MKAHHLLILALAASAGCDRSCITFSGQAFTSDIDRVESTILRGGPVGAPENCHPIEGVRVFLSRTRDGAPIAEKFTATSDKDGNFSFTVVMGELGDKEVYFIATKPGYEPVSQQVTVGPLSPYLRTHLVLKKAAANK